ncbi:MAG TPA: RNA methyltransferase [Microbacteriaceae bacterium]|nr:RNA methyltransferase [Microbacteriaceae bacterium]
MLDDPHAPAVRAAARLAGGRGRRRTGLFLAEGPQAVREALLHRPDLVERVYATGAALAAHDDLARLVDTARVSLAEASERVVQALADTVTPQGVVAVCRMPAPGIADVFAAGPRLLVALHEVRDPGNAGTIIRAADAAGAGGVFLTALSVDPYNPKAVRAATGSHFHLPVVTGVALGDVRERAAAAGIQLIAADVKGDDLLVARREGVLERPTLWLFGNEAHGLADEQLAAADRVLRLPIYGRAESLNLATAAAVCLYESALALQGSR